MNEKDDMLALVALDSKVYKDNQAVLDASRQRLFESIKQARKSRATQQEIADATVVGDEGLSRQRIAQIIAGD